MQWIRGDTVGRGSFAKVNLALPKSRFDQIPNEKKQQLSSAIAVKTATSDFAGAVSSIQNEKEILQQLQGCPQIITCLGSDQTIENGTVCHNLFMEYAENGSLADQLSSNGRFSVTEIRAFTDTIVKGLCFIHEKGFAHCDIKLQNILSFANGEVKISDFGLSRCDGEGGVGFVGTPLYMAPEAATGLSSMSVAPADVWALGCAVIEMATGKPAWGSERRELAGLIRLIGSGEQSPVIPEEELGADGRDFVEKCLVRDPNQRWTAKMLLDHPFVSSLRCNQKLTRESPRGPFDFPEEDLSSPIDVGEMISQWGNSPAVTAVDVFSWDELEVEDEIVDLDSGMERIAGLSGVVSVVDWSDSSEWVTVR